MPPTLSSVMATTPQVRLLQCLDCLTVDALPPALPSEIHEDRLLAKLLEGHQGPLNRHQLSQLPPGAPRRRDIIPSEPHIVRSLCIDPGYWNAADPEQRRLNREEIIRGMWSSEAGYPDEFYATKDTFTVDAGLCYNRHQRPGSEKGPHRCLDYHDDSKRLTDPEWRARGEKMGFPRDDVFLCDFCPYESVIVTEKRANRGDYK